MNYDPLLIKGAIFQIFGFCHNLLATVRLHKSKGLVERTTLFVAAFKGRGSFSFLGPHQFRHASHNPSLFHFSSTRRLT